MGVDGRVVIVGLLLARLARHGGAAQPDAGDDDFDCELRRLAYCFGTRLLPARGRFVELQAALESEACAIRTCAPVSGRGSWAPAGSDRAEYTPVDVHATGLVIHVDPTIGDDANAGTAELPLRTPRAALARYARSQALRGEVVLRGGTYWLEQPLMLGPEHSGLRVRGSVGERAVLAGGKRLQPLRWRAHDVSRGRNVWRASLKDVDLPAAGVRSLLVDGVRATRARFPNLPGGIEVSPRYGSVISTANVTQWMAPRAPATPAQSYVDDEPRRWRNGSSDGWFQRYTVGVGGPCEVFDPPVSFWCSKHATGGGASMFGTPSGVRLRAHALPNGPYDLARARRALVHVWHPGRWENWMFDVANYSVHAEDGSHAFHFGRGGFQGARGAPSGGELHVENLLEELDAPGEWYFDEARRELYLWYDAPRGGAAGADGEPIAAPPPAGTQLVVPSLISLVLVRGSAARPVRDLEISGLEITATRPSFMEPHAVLSGGDWSLERTAAVVLEGVERARVSACNFTRLDGHALLISGRARNVSVVGSNFELLGGSAIVAWGRTREVERGEGGRLVPSPAGVDGTDGEHPDRTLVLGNVAREVGLFTKQSSFFVQAKAARSRVEANVFFNGPRAGISLNDGFGGGDVLARNLVFGTCRESSDHGPFNSWDRQPFLTGYARRGAPSVTMLPRTLERNLLIVERWHHGRQWAIDNDDGSAGYLARRNVLAYGDYGLKSDYGGHDSTHVGNLYLRMTGAVMNHARQLEGRALSFAHNRAVLTADSVGDLECNPPGATRLRNNTYFTPSGVAMECGMPLRFWQELKPGAHDPGSRAARAPSTAVLMQWAWELLGPAEVAS